ncbi:unnamed protein product [Ranitomeya imitator]|uniref:KRIT1/FRMD8 FERM domain-containing protein n=1 Tax=Ranitomeya imitator TaxID=111125 RepID=A0ABN9KTW4_9NEOB|nr:unnamed protein product [Ranitomeya imitator]
MTSDAGDVCAAADISRQPPIGWRLLLLTIDVRARARTSIGNRRSAARGPHVLLSLKFFELSWDHTYPDEEEHILWLEFDGDNEGTPVNKLLKIYSKQAELMSGLIEYCIELSQGNDLPSPETIPGISHDSGKRTNLRRQESVVCNRIKNLTTIDYVDDGTEIKRVKPKRSASFFNRQSTHSYASVQPSETPGQS